MNPLTVASTDDTVLIVTSRKRQHGGRRRGAGRRSVLGVKLGAKPFAMDFTSAGLRALDALTRRTQLSRNAVIATLALQHADEVDETIVQTFPIKSRKVLSIRVPASAAVKLRAARRRTGRSYSDIGEILVTLFAGETTFPTP